MKHLGLYIPTNVERQSHGLGISGLVLQQLQGIEGENDFALVVMVRGFTPGRLMSEVEIARRSEGLHKLVNL